MPQAITEALKYKKVETYDPGAYPPAGDQWGDLTMKTENGQYLSTTGDWEQRLKNAQQLRTKVSPEDLQA